MIKISEEITLIVKKHSRVFLFATLSIFFWFATFYEAFISAARVWWVSEIYTHGFFILPITAYFVWRKRHELAEQSPKPAYIALIPLFSAGFIYILGLAGDISLFQHAAIFTILPLTIWLLFGTKIAKTILFPLFFILFSIPFGEEFIPLLQKITADNSVWLLRLVDIPVYRNGLYIDIPNGRFVVAEACSGVRFFVGSAVFGAIYAYISYAYKIKQFIFFIIALIIPILANSIRVSAIILIGYFSDMKYATGVDHLVYGWIFFAIVIVLLIFIGNLWSDQVFQKERKVIKDSESDLRDNLRLPFLFVFGIYFLIILWASVIELHKQEYEQLALKIETEIQGLGDESWKPIFNGASIITNAKYLAENEQSIEYFSAFYKYNTTNTELISSENRIYSPEAWTLKSSKNIHLKLSEDKDTDALLYSLVGTNQEYRLVLFWYEIGMFKTSSKVFIKLAQSYEALFGKPGGGRIVIYSTKYQEDNKETSIRSLIELVEKNYHQ